MHQFLILNFKGEDDSKIESLRVEQTIARAMQMVERKVGAAKSKRSG